MSVILAIDPGTTQSGWCIYDGARVRDSGVSPNAGLLCWLNDLGVDRLAIERIQGYGMVVGREVFETCEWVGRFAEAWRGQGDPLLIYRREVKLHLCGSSQAKDPNVRQALIDLFPATGGGKCPQIGIKSAPGPLFGISSHAWAALGVAVVAAHRIEKMKEAA